MMRDGLTLGTDPSAPDIAGREAGQFPQIGREANPLGAGSRFQCFADIRIKTDRNGRGHGGTRVVCTYMQCECVVLSSDNHRARRQWPFASKLAPRQISEVLY